MRHRRRPGPSAPPAGRAQPGRAAAALALVLALALACACGSGREEAAGGAAPPAPAGAPDAAAPGVALPHLGQGARVIASSTHLGAPGEGPPSNLVDGDPATAWSSAYADNQEVLIDLGAVHQVGRLRMLWAAASARSFSVQISPMAAPGARPSRPPMGGSGRASRMSRSAPRRAISASP